MQFIGESHIKDEFSSLLTCKIEINSFIFPAYIYINAEFLASYFYIIFADFVLEGLSRYLKHFRCPCNVSLGFL